MLKSYLCDYSDAQTVAKGTINVSNPNNDPYDQKLSFKNNAPFISCITIHSLTMQKTQTL